MYLQAILALTRYALVCSSYKMTGKTAIAISAAGSFLPFIIFFLPLTGIWGELGYEKGSGNHKFCVQKNMTPFVGTCTILPGSFKIFIMAFGPGLPYLVIIFSYVMILKKYKKSRNKILEHSLSCRNSLTERDRRMSKVMETSFYEKRKNLTKDA